MADNGANPYKGNTKNSKRDENIYSDSPIIVELLQSAKKLETGRYRLMKTDVVRDVKMGDFAIYDKLMDKKYYFVRKDVRISICDGNKGRYLISTPNPMSAMQIDDELEGFLVKVAGKLKSELKTEQMATHRAYISPMGINCILRKKTEDRFLPSFLPEDLEKMEARKKHYMSDLRKYVPEWQATCWVQDEAMGMRIPCEDGVLLFNYMADRVGFISNEDKVLWTVNTSKYDVVIRDFEQYRQDTRPLEDENFWKKRN